MISARDKKARRSKGLVGRFSDLDIGVVSGLAGYVASLKPVIWNRMGQGFTLVQGRVSKWDDVSGNGNHMLQSIALSRPVVQPDGSLLFDGLNGYLRAVFALAQPSTVYMLVKQITWTLSRRLFDSVGTSSALRQGETSPGINSFAGVAVSAQNNGLAIGVYGTVSVVFNGSHSSLQVNNGLASDEFGGSQAFDGVTLGNAGGTPPGLPGNVQIAEFVAYRGAHDSIQRSLLHRYLMTLGQVSP